MGVRLLLIKLSAVAMSRYRHKSAEITMDLFPFLSILACTIGALILLIIVMTTQTMGNQQKVKIIAKQEGDQKQGQDQSKSPRYLECSEKGVILYPEKITIPSAQLKQNPALKTLLDQLSKNRDKEYLIVAVRPGGIDTFQTLRTLVESRGIDIGYEPFEDGLQLNFETESTPQL